MAFASKVADVSASTETLKVEHVFVFSWSDKAEDVICKLAVGLLDLSRSITQSCRILGYGATAYLVLLGTSKLITSFQTKRRGSDEDNYGIL